MLACPLFVEAPRDLRVGQPIGRVEHNPRSLHILKRQLLGAPASKGSFLPVLGRRGALTPRRPCG